MVLAPLTICGTVVAYNDIIGWPGVWRLTPTSVHSLIISIALSKPVKGGLATSLDLDCRPLGCDPGLRFKNIMDLLLGPTEQVPCTEGVMSV